MSFLPSFPRLAPLLLGLLCLTGTTHAALKVGDPAPSIAPAKWVKGEPVKAFEGDQVYIVEFWATWCGPCVQAIPHLNETYKKFKDKGLVVIGQNLDEDAATIQPFIKQMGSKMTYRVTCDDGSGRMGKTWLEAAGQNGIPCGFVVDKAGKIAYIGHPMALKESLLVQLLAAPSTKPATATAAPAAPVAPSPEAQALADQTAAAIAAGKFDDAEAAIAKLQELLPESLRHLAGMLEIDRLIATRHEDDAAELGKMLAEDFKSQPAVVNAVAARLVAGAAPAAPLLAAAETTATPLAAVAAEPQFAALGTLARVAFLRGDAARAVELQTKAVAAAPPAAAASAAATLATYQKAPAKPQAPPTPPTTTP